jgi:hypothetical protein
MNSKALLAAAVTGIMFAGATPAFADGAKDGKSGSSDAPDKHSCKGKNACKGQGGCKSDKNSCKGQNACKGKGGCKA